MDEIVVLSASGGGQENAVAVLSPRSMASGAEETACAERGAEKPIRHADKTVRYFFVSRVQVRIVCI